MKYIEYVVKFNYVIDEHVAGDSPEEIADMLNVESPNAASWIEEEARTGNYLVVSAHLVEAEEVEG